MILCFFFCAVYCKFVSFWLFLTAFLFLIVSRKMVAFVGSLILSMLNHQLVCFVNHYASKDDMIFKSLCQPDQNSKLLSNLNATQLYIITDQKKHVKIKIHFNNSLKIGTLGNSMLSWCNFIENYNATVQINIFKGILHYL